MLHNPFPRALFLKKYHLIFMFSLVLGPFSQLAFSSSPNRVPEIHQPHKVSPMVQKRDSRVASIEKDKGKEKETILKVTEGPNSILPHLDSKTTLLLTLDIRPSTPLDYGKMSEKELVARANGNDKMAQVIIVRRIISECAKKRSCRMHGYYDTRLNSNIFKDIKIETWKELEDKAIQDNGYLLFLIEIEKISDFPKIIKSIKEQAKNGNPKTQFFLGWMNEYGKGVPCNDSKAVKWYKVAAEYNIPEAEYSLGWMYEKGKGVTRNDKQAAEWYEKAANQGHAGAQFNLGWMLEHGRKGLPKNEKLAARWYEEATKQNIAQALYYLGQMYKQGRGVPKITSKAEEMKSGAFNLGYSENAVILSGDYKKKAVGILKKEWEASVQYINAVNRGSSKCIWLVPQEEAEKDNRVQGSIGNHPSQEKSLSDQVSLSSIEHAGTKNAETARGQKRSITSSSSIKPTPSSSKDRPSKRQKPDDSPLLGEIQTNKMHILETQEKASLLKELETYLLEKADIKLSAKHGDKDYQHRLGYLYQQMSKIYSIKKLKVSYLNKAVKWYQKAAGQGSKEGQTALISLRDSGSYSNPDKEAMEWYKRTVAIAGLNFEEFIQAINHRANVLKLSDFIFIDIDNGKYVPSSIEAGASRKQDMANHIFTPLFKSADHRKYEDSIMAIDPSGDGKDETAYCVAKRCGDYYFITALGGMAGGYNEKEKDRVGNSPEVLEKLASVARDHKVHYILIEKNSDNSFASLLKRSLGQDIGIIKWHQYLNKERRIIDTLQPLLETPRLVMDRKVLKEDFESEPCADMNYKFFYQLMTITASPVSPSTQMTRQPVHDDRLDAVAMAIKHLRVKKEGEKGKEYFEEEL
jgi:TPR repeat protein